MARISIAAACVGLTLVGQSAAFAATTGTFTGGSDTSLTAYNWNVAANWNSNPNGAVPGVTSAAGDIANVTRDITATTTINVDTNLLLSSLFIGDSVVNGSSYTLGASGTNAITFNGNGAAAVLQQTVTSAGNTVNVGLILASDLELSTRRSQFNVGSKISGTGNIVVTPQNASTLYLTNANNDYVGNFTLNGGTVLLGGSDGIFGSRSSGTRVITLANGNVNTDTLLRLNGAFTVGSNRQFAMGTGGGVIDLNGRGFSFATADQLTGANSFTLYNRSGGTTGTGTIGGSNASFTGTLLLGTRGTGNVALTLGAANAVGGDIQVASVASLALSNANALAAGKSITLLSGSLSTAGLTDFTLAAGQTVAGVGTWTTATNSNTVSGVLSVGSTHAVTAGATAGTISVTGPLALAGEARFDLFAATGSADKVNQAGTLTYGGFLTVANLTGSSPAVGSSWDLFDFTTQSGTFNNAFGTPGDGVYLPLLTAGQWAFDYNTGTLSVTAIPEPTALAAAGLAAAALLRRRRA